MSYWQVQTRTPGGPWVAHGEYEFENIAREHAEWLESLMGPAEATEVRVVPMNQPKQVRP